MMVSKTIKIIIVAMIVVDAQAQQKVLKESYKEDFYLLCDVMRTTTGLWSTASDHEDLIEQVNEISKKIDEIFFGLIWRGKAGGGLNLPMGFTDANIRRSNVCGYHDGAEGFPSASSSLVYSIFCLCTSTNKDEKDLCGLKVDGIGAWPEEWNENVKDTFEKVWYGDENNAGVVKKCGDPSSSDNVEKEKINFAGSLAKIEDTLKVKGGTLGKNETSCGKTSACANVTQAPMWLKKLKEIEEITKEIKETPTPAVPRKKEMHNSKPTQDIHTTTHTPAPEHVMSKDPVETTEQEAQKAPEEEPKPQPKVESENTLEDIPRKKAEKTEDPLPVPENNETSGSFITRPKWPLWAAFHV